MTKKILLVDDSQLIRDVVSTALQEAGYLVIVQESPFGTGAAILREKPDLVLLDVEMPGLDGSVLARLCSRHHGETKVVLYSSVAVPRLEALARNSGATAYVSKNAGLEHLLTRLKELL